jgi:RES domain-containing protein
MPVVWRLAPPRFAHLLDGEGSYEGGGRWNSPGGRAIYTSSHLSLCVLEVYAHFPAQERDRLPDLEALRISVPDDASRTEISAQRFEKLMHSPDPMAACQAVGDEWLSRGSDLIMQAPSVVVPEENIMLNPAHPRMQEVTIVTSRRFRFDPRLGGGLR